eukprot:scaffold1202_cov61-Phaeocystis_antarctica.AAC.4
MRMGSCQRRTAFSLSWETIKGGGSLSGVGLGRTPMKASDGAGGPGWMTTAANGGTATSKSP